MYDYENETNLERLDETIYIHSFYYMLGTDPGEVFTGIPNQHKYVAILSQEMLDSLAIGATKFALLRGDADGFIAPEIIPKLQKRLASGREIWIKWT